MHLHAALLGHKLRSMNVGSETNALIYFLIQTKKEVSLSFTSKVFKEKAWA